MIAKYRYDMYTILIIGGEGADLAQRPEVTILIIGCYNTNNTKIR